jgi:signal transduction histidine kinase
MENELTIIIVVGIFVLTYLFLYLYFSTKQKKQELAIKVLSEEKECLSEKLQNAESTPQIQEKTNSKSVLVYEQTKKIEYLESEVVRQRKRIRELKLIAQNANMAQEDFLSNVTEEVTTPVNSILSSSTLLKEKAKDSKTSQELENIVASSKRLLVMLNGIVDLSKMQAKTFQIHESTVDIKFLLSSLVDKKQKVADEKSLDFILKVDETLPDFLLIDAAKTEDILENLVDNAIKFTQDGYVKINVLVDNIDIVTNTVDVSFYVEDTGAGIAQDFQDQVFGVFERVVNREDRASQTVGLGLSIDKKIALSMQGDITFKSEISKGSVFRFSLRGLEIPLWSSADRTEDENVDFSLLREDAKIMIIAEYNKNYQTIVDAFQTSEATLFAYSDFRDAVQTLRDETVDLVFIDVDILNNDEGAVSKVLANMTKASIVPLVTSRIKEIDFGSTALKPSGYLKKPLSKSELFKISLRLLNSL